MEKLSLNNEIVLCRSVVKKARVRIIRKMIAKLKILRSCKKEEDKEKKLKKADRLLEQILILKKIKPDEVTKFALKNQNLDSILQTTPANQKDHAYATLAIFPELQKIIANIRERIPDWENQLPKMLQELGTRSMLKKWKRINKGLPAKPLPKIPKEERIEDPTTEKPVVEDSSKTVKKVDKKPKPKPEPVVEEKPEVKVDDPFFVSKKVAIPKLLLNEVEENPGMEIKFSRDEPERRQFRRDEPERRQFRRDEPERRQFNQLRPAVSRNFEIVEKQPEEEKLHPSWAAKKVKLIQPFKGKKIKFDD